MFTVKANDIVLQEGFFTRDAAEEYIDDQIAAEPANAVRFTYIIIDEDEEKV